MILHVLVVARLWVREVSGAAVLVADGILVDRSVGLGCAIVGRGDTITGFTAIVAVPVIHSAVWVFIYKKAHGKRHKKLTYSHNIRIERGGCFKTIIKCGGAARGPRLHETNPSAQC